MSTQDSKSYPPPSIMIFAGLLGLMQFITFVARLSMFGTGEATDEQLITGIIINLITLTGCLLLWKLRKLGLWIVIAAMVALAGVQVVAHGNAVGDAFSFAIPFILIAVACTVPHFDKMR